MDNSNPKSQNLMNIIRLLKHSGQLTRQDVAKTLGISMPTVLHSIEELLSRNIIIEAGENASTGGRRAKTFSLNQEGRYGIGIQVTRKHLRLALTNLSGEVKQVVKIFHPFQDQVEWYRTLGEHLTDFTKSADIDDSLILGAGLSFPGIIDQEHHMILHSHVFNIKNVSLDRFYKYIDYPLIVVNDANCACFAEQNHEKNSFFYISLNESVGGSLMIDHQLFSGMNWRTGEAGHMVIHPGGRRCYCGKEGCADAYLASGVLSGEDEELDSFFKKLASGDEKSTGIWDDYLNNLAILISNINMLLDMDIVVGGDVGARMEPYIERLSEKTAKLDMFSRDVEYIYPCKCREHIFLIGAALRAVDYFDCRLLG